MMKRVFFDILLLVLMFLLPWWVVVALSIIGLFVFKNFYEFLLSSIIIYILYSPPESFGLNNSIFIYLGIIIFYLLVQYLRRHIILYKNNDAIPYKS